MQARWGVSNPGMLILTFALLAIAIGVGTYGHIAGLTAGEFDFLDRLHADIWATTGAVMTVAAAAVAILVRVSSRPTEGGAVNDTDLSILYIVATATAAFAIVSLVMGMSDRSEATSFWINYAIIFAFAAIAWAAVARPVPQVVQAVGLRSEVIGLILVAAVGVAGIIGLATGQGDDVVTDSGNLGGDYLTGSSWLNVAFVAALLAFAWFLGMRKTQA